MHRRLDSRGSALFIQRFVAWQCSGGAWGHEGVENAVVAGLHRKQTYLLWRGDAQVTHGDMKAQNVLITGRWAKITDVGVARVMTAPEQLAPEVTLGT